MRSPVHLQNRVKEISGIKFGPDPPTFHEIRSLASRLYELENGEDFAQR